MNKMTLNIKTRWLLDLYPSQTMGQNWGPDERLTPNQAPFDHTDNNLLRVLEAPVNEVQHFADGTCAWVVHVALFVFGVQGTLWTQTGNFVDATTPLAAVDYIFEPNNQNNRTSKDVCSHLIPKRLGPSGVDSIIYRYTGMVSNWQNHRPDWDCRVAVLLYGALDGFVDSFTMGFYNPDPTATQYQVHQFVVPVRAADQNLVGLQGWTKLALRWESIVTTGFQVGANEVNQLNLHDSAVNFPANGGNNIPNPPFEVLGWHYVQCVLRKWSTTAYRGYANINW
ncbi:hypothetical protein QBC33DRAFT_604033 [Phialemonium atrogriseum]|uniref:Uncharacterized protein n=1 Tax=Phialemonium atrogriseum TaxID=1093897 RepID=A0AAJ0BRI3_9PEZI|nr:uncharacterized protein QBC33DRAFT_604033 [Phialemonium atrogriseum]KAK1761692.1 hypothetical protein QBC33DRAFT_604033 [Phialemonium atrogriseum]